MRQIPRILIRFCYLSSKWGAVSALIAIVLLNCANMISRWFLNAPFDWVLEMSLILFVDAVMLILPVIYHDKAFIRMHLVDEFIGPRCSMYINAFADGLVLAFMACLLYKGLALSLGQFHILSRGLGIPRIYVTLPVSIGAALSLPIGLSIFVQNLRGIVNGREETRP